MVGVVAGKVGSQQVKNSGTTEEFWNFTSVETFTLSLATKFTSIEHEKLDKTDNLLMTILARFLGNLRVISDLLSGGFVLLDTC